MGTETTKYRIVLDDKLSPAMRKALKSANAFDNKMKVIDKQAKKTGKSLTSAFGKLAIGAGFVAGITLMARSIIKLGAAMEQTRITFTTLLGDAAQGNKLMNDLIKLAAVTPLKTNEVLNASKVLLAFGTEASKVEKTIRFLGDVSTATGSDLRNMARNFGQIRQAGRLTGKELLSLVDAGFNPLEEIAKKTGRSQAVLRKEMEKGLISFKMVEDAFISVTGEGGRFFGLMDKQSKTLSGRWSTLMSNIELTAATMGESVTSGLGQAVTALNDFVVNQAGSMMQAFGVVTDGIGNVFGALGRLGQRLTGAKSGMDAWVEILGAVGFAFATIANTITLVIDTVSALWTSLTSVADFITGDFDAGMATLAKADVQLGEAFGSFGDNMLEAFLNSVKTPEQKKEDNTVLSGGSGGTGGAAGSSLSAGAKSTGIAGAQSKVRNITISIENMVRNINFNDVTYQQSEAQLTEMVKRALLTAVSDVNIIAR